MSGKLRKNWIECSAGDTMCTDTSKPIFALSLLEDIRCITQRIVVTQESAVKSRNLTGRTFSTITNSQDKDIKSIKVCVHFKSRK